ncbi:recombinase RecA [Candidatus Roizmanbacteria bacterium RIFCSPHIGHO2_02_FULL_40_13b]|uniref:Protein RecA n=1 Tax=Candidatus Roizmanbacteria bacterium RIFCSPHIGHO2_01_FULL_39_24 TaxID=1802032 RepID=A0A1F7GKV3_9BACT|nr:MAG: recombinase RecA [Candidatus Roizmanbacteria bacterium RIFCSPHIGHO2_01_FULL_39_24]OGK27994.1 MAG: recombinase RecA [Candidatus Roizmanbacteria bacterium RIFCSPHIGHO2_02_FULL_40_13b]OGK49214.1 MAG: recombinase RecA [Candidatus Roizmanbacteria bacterium RIFCSPLOWO2_01_FULL_40_32]
MDLDKKSPKFAAVQAVVDQIQRQYGKGSIMRLGDQATIPVEVFKTNILPLDIALGVGGIPKGRIVEIYGPEASGKTTICLNLIAQVQNEGGIAAFIDAEHALDPAWAITLGVNLDDLLISQPDTGEQALEIAESLIRSGGVDVVVIDSVAALVPKSEIEGDMGDAQMGVQARLMSQALRKLTSVVSKSKTTVVFTNQLRMKIGVMFGNPETTPGGMALKFYCSLRMDVRKIETIKKGDQVVGTRTRVKIVKNKVAPPFKEATFVVTKDGIDKEGSVVDAALDLEILTKSGAFIKMGDIVVGQGRDQARETILGDPKLKKQITDEVYKKAFGKVKEPVAEKKTKEEEPM